MYLFINILCELLCIPFGVFECKSVGLLELNKRRYEIHIRCCGSLICSACVL